MINQEIERRSKGCVYIERGEEGRERRANTVSQTWLVSPRPAGAWERPKRRTGHVSRGGAAPGAAEPEPGAGKV